MFCARISPSSREQEEEEEEDDDGDSDSPGISARIERRVGENADATTSESRKSPCRAVS